MVPSHDRGCHHRLSQIETKAKSLARSVTSKKPLYLLSQLGKDLGGDLRDLKLLQDQTLAEFVAERLSDEFKLVQTGAHGNVQALIRLVELDGQLVPIPEVSSAGEQKHPRYHYRFWAAFSVPLETGDRYLNLDDFSFSAEPVPADGNYLQIAREFVASPEASDRDSLIRENISRWLQINGLAAERFLARASASSALKPRDRKSSLLELVIEALDPEQLASTTLSLDVVAGLLRKRV